MDWSMESNSFQDQSLRYIGWLSVILRRVASRRYCYKMGPASSADQIWEFVLEPPSGWSDGGIWYSVSRKMWANLYGLRKTGWNLQCADLHISRCKWGVGRSARLFPSLPVRLAPISFAGRSFKIDAYHPTNYYSPLSTGLRKVTHCG